MADPVTIDLRHVARGLGIPLRQVEAVVELLDDGNTVPFITRYRKDATGGLDEEQIRQVQTRLKKLRMLAERKETILRSVESQGKLTEKLSRQILAAGTTKRLEDLYLPFKPKKQTLATVARTRGLEPLALEILNATVQGADLDARAKDFASPDRQVPTAADALLGAGHILTEQFGERADLRHHLREILQRSGRLVCTQIAPEPRPPAEKTERASSAGRPPAPTFSTDTAADPSSGARLPRPVDGPISAGWVAMPEEAVISFDTTDPVPESPVMAPGPTCPAESAEASDPGPAEVSPAPASEADPEVFSSMSAQTEAAELPTEWQGMVPEIAFEVVDAGGPVSVVSSQTPPLAAAAPAAGTETPPPPPPRPAASKKSNKAAQLREKREQKKKKAEERKQKAFRDYYEYSEEIRKIPPHRVLAINRGERARVLRVKLDCDLAAMDQAAEEICVPPGHPHADFLRGCACDALARFILPGLEREMRRELTERAEMHAVEVFARNLRNLLLVSPVRDRRILAVDPGYKSGCKLVAIDQFGNVLGHNTIFLIGKPERREEGRRTVGAMVEQFELSVVAIGNGTACRQAEEFVGEMLEAELKEKGVCYVIVNEAGASVYSTSRLGREEFPQHDATVRGAISIARRLQDPLSELVKIDPPNLGVGLYQHDIKANHLRESLDEVVESCVNYVGVDVNTASPALLRYVSGLNQLTARRLYEYRLEHGPFRSREQLKEVPGIGEATFVQAAGFLKVIAGDNPLDATWIHPESYAVASRVMERLGITPADLVTPQSAANLSERIGKTDVGVLAAELQVGAMLLKDIVSQLARPGRDPREDLPAPVFKRGVLKLEDLTPAMELTGTVLNVVDFGAFVDIGMHDSGLVHVSHLADKFVRDPHEVVAVGDIVRVWVIDVDKQRRRVSLSMIPPGHERSGPRRPSRPQGPPRTEAPTSSSGPPARPAGRGRPEGQQGSTSRPPRGDRPRFGGRSPERGDSRAPDRGPPKPRPPRPKPLTPLTDEMKTGKEPLRSFGDLLQFYGLQGQPAATDADRGKKGPDNRGKDAGRRKDQGQKPQEDRPKPAAAAPQAESAQPVPEPPAAVEVPSPAPENLPADAIPPQAGDAPAPQSPEPTPASAGPTEPPSATPSEESPPADADSTAPASPSPPDAPAADPSGPASA